VAVGVDGSNGIVVRSNLVGSQPAIINRQFINQTYVLNIAAAAALSEAQVANAAVGVLVAGVARTGVAHDRDASGHGHPAINVHPGRAVRGHMPFFHQNDVMPTAVVDDLVAVTTGENLDDIRGAEGELAPGIEPTPIHVAIPRTLT